MMRTPDWRHEGLRIKRSADAFREADMIYSDPRPAALTLIESGDLSVEDLWHQYRSNGGRADASELEAFIHDIPLLNGVEVEILGEALNQLRSTGPKSGISKRGSGRFTRPLSMALKRILRL